MSAGLDEMSGVGRITKRDTLARMPAPRAISVRLDDEALKALRLLESSGYGRSAAIRQAILDAAARLRDKRALRAEVTSLEDDVVDRREMSAIASMMESLRAPR